MTKRTKSSRHKESDSSAPVREMATPASGEVIRPPRRNLPLLITSSTLFFLGFLFLLYVAIFP